MKFEEVLPAFREGKRIRRKIWASMCTEGVELKMDDLLAFDWEIIEEVTPISRVPEHITGYVMDKLNEVIDRLNYLTEKLEQQ